MRSFYASTGVSAWSDGVVPFFITSNAQIAKTYAQVIHGYIADLARASSGSLDPSAPIYVFELGAGSGKFSFLLIKALLEREELMAPVRDGEIWI